VEVLRGYLNKLHDYRTGQLRADDRALVQDNFNAWAALNEWRNASPLVGTAAVSSVDFVDGVIPGQGGTGTYLWAFGQGPGAGNRMQTEVGGITSGHYLLGSNAAFSAMFGSWFGDFDGPDNLLRSSIAGPGLGLASVYGLPGTNQPGVDLNFRAMAMGHDLGYAIRETQAAFAGLPNPGYSSGVGVTLNIMGDPTLRLKYVARPSGGSVAANTGGSGVVLSWSASPDAALDGFQGYLLYRRTSGGTLELVDTGGYVTGTSYTYTGGSLAESYLVRAVRLVTTGSGSYYDRSLPVALPAAAFVGRDDTTAGDWRGTYGLDGQLIYQDGDRLPADVTYTPVGTIDQWVWESSTTDPRALRFGATEDPNTPRRAATAFSNTSFEFDLDIGSASSKEISLYFLDDDYRDRSQRIEVLDPGSGAVLSSYDLSDFQGGTYLTWSVSGHVRFRITNLNPDVNAVLSGIFVD
jgi:hypothetical protein